MNVLYIIDQDIHSGKTSGIVHKIHGKMKLWEEKGHTVQILSLYSFRLYNASLELLDENYSFEIKKHSKLMTLFRLVYSSYLLKKHLHRFQCDLIYMRTRLYTPFIRKALLGHKVIFELNSDDVEEWRCNNKVIWKYNNVTRKYFYNIAKAFVSVSYELTHRYQEFDKPTITIGNGISATKYPVNIVLKNEKPQVGFVGSPGFKWHGIDKILWLAQKCKDVDFHIVGEDGQDLDNVKFYGYLKEKEVSEVLLSCDVAISTLSLHEKNMNEASPLKSRQYLALGVPLIYAYKDTDLSGSEEFALQISNSKDNVENHLSEIQKFIKICHGNEELRKKARGFAENKLDVKSKELERLEFFNKVVGKNV